MTTCKFLILLTSVFLVLLPPYSYALQAQSAEEMLRLLEGLFDNVSDVSGGFVQKSLIKDLKRTDTYKGRFYKKATALRWDYVGADPQSVFIKDGIITIFQKNQKQAIVSAFNEQSYGQTPLALLNNVASLRKDFLATTSATNTLELTAKKPDTITKIILKLTEGDFPISTITIIDRYSNKIDITLSDVKTNTNLPDSHFVFKPAKDIKVIRH